MKPFMKINKAWALPNSLNEAYNLVVEGQNGVPSNAYDLIASSNNKIFDS